MVFTSVWSLEARLSRERGFVAWTIKAAESFLSDQRRLSLFANDVFSNEGLKMAAHKNFTIHFKKCDELNEKCVLMSTRI
jgi:hypothetical protein